MKTTILFFFALFFTIIFIITHIEWFIIKFKKNAHEYTTFEFTTVILICIFWSFVFYLTQ